MTDRGREVVFAQAIRTALREEMQRDESVILWGQDIGVYGGVYGATTGLQREFGEDRVRDAPISEMAIAGVAVGAALLGMRPVVEIMYADFLMHAADAIANQAAKWRFMSGGQFKVPAVFRSPAGGGSGYAAQHSQNIESWFCHIPGLKVVCPCMPPRRLEACSRAPSATTTPSSSSSTRATTPTAGPCPRGGAPAPRQGRREARGHGRHLGLLVTQPPLGTGGG